MCVCVCTLSFLYICKRETAKISLRKKESNLMERGKSPNIHANLRNMSLNVIYCCITNYPLNLAVKNNQRFISSKFLRITAAGRASRWHSDKESACQYMRCKRSGFDSWLGGPLQEDMATTCVFFLRTSIREPCY